ncbi:thymidylate synthase [Schizosaccharomyces japonicus yFS275]|uniref:thymidylate synthase n=1 Tax=Schizosaccharomyces japonicus (strain yFS275 / FY16936) TaxID=402676 RepID=B6K7B9_SCHJY|nr:thymidylate synthase [Schizosaccharomyces japonicus yFS275]EEB09423.1 thymidylate synthase [Schizosaccharomyces japonicus yFS275]
MTLHAKFSLGDEDKSAVKESDAQRTDGKRHILVAATGSVAAIKLVLLVNDLLSYKDVEVQVVLTQAARTFVKVDTLKALGVRVWCDEDDWRNWTDKTSPITHIELRRWAHLLLIAPLSANTLAKAANGLCDNLLTCLIRAWSPNKPMLLAPAMNTVMWKNPITEKHLTTVRESYKQAEIIHPIEKVLACGDIGMGGMCEWREIVARLVHRFDLQRKDEDEDNDNDNDNDFDDNSLVSPINDVEVSLPSARKLPKSDEVNDAASTVSAPAATYAPVSDSIEEAETSTLAKAPNATCEQDVQIENGPALKEEHTSIPDIVPSNKEEQQYLDLIKRILETGELRNDRTGTGTRSIFAPPQLRFSLSNNTLPLLTTKKVFLRGVLQELLWFLRGDTNAKHLTEKDIHIWDGNGSREFLDKMGFFDRAEGDLGPVYGFQWRHFGAKYTDCNADYTGQGVDQLAQVVHQLKNNPNDRRIIMSAWNPAAIPQMALPPCHLLCQFYVSAPAQPGGRPRLSCMMYQRSADMGLGVPFNIASYSLLTHMLAHYCNYEAHEFIHVMGDCHIYIDHIEALRTQLARKPLPFPKIHFRRSPREVGSIDGYEYDDFVVEGYNPWGPIKMKMSV